MVLWRHGRTRWNSTGRFQGQTDVDLDDTGRVQAERAAAMLASLQPAAVVTSDLRRTVDTAAPLVRLTGLRLGIDPALRETHAGRWQGLTFAEIQQRYPDEVAAWDRGDVGFRPGGGESRAEVAERFAGAVERALAPLADDATLVVVSHGGAARVGMCRLLGLPEETWSALGGLSNCCWSVLSWGRVGWRLVEHNAGSLPQPVLVQEG